MNKTSRVNNYYNKQSREIIMNVAETIIIIMNIAEKL